MRTFARLLSFLAPYRTSVIASVVLAGLAMAMTVAIPWLIGQAVDAIEDGRRAELPPLAGAAVGAGLLRLALTVGRRLFSGQVSLGVEYDLRNRFYGHLQELHMGFFDAQQTGQLMSRATVDLQAIRFFLGYGLIFISQNLLTILFAGAVMLAISPLLALAALAPVPVVVLVAMRFGYVNRPAQQEVQQRLAELTGEAQENVSGANVVKAFAREGRQMERFRHRATRLFDQAIVATRIRAHYGPLIAFLPNIGLVAMLLWGGNMVIEGSLALGDFVAFYAYLVMLLAPMRMLGMALGMAQRAVAGGNRLFEILDREPEVRSRPGSPPLPDGAGRIEVRDVTFAYGESGSGAAIRDVTFEVEAGQTLALVGPTGSGKTTLLALVSRLYDVGEGAILVDGADVRDVQLASLRNQIAVVGDDTFLFSASIAENIAYAHPAATPAEIERAAARAQIHEFVAGLPAGYETAVGERGVTLSGGERQRVAIARALIADPRILVLDDATASVDAATDAAIRRGLAEVMRGRTTLIVAHRASSIALADRIAVLDAGRLAAFGTHEDLMARSPLYRSIFEGSTAEPRFVAEREREVAGL